jgi:hypothetical protein
MKARNRTVFAAALGVGLAGLAALAVPTAYPVANQWEYARKMFNPGKALAGVLKMEVQNPNAAMSTHWYSYKVGDAAQLATRDWYLDHTTWSVAFDPHPTAPHGLPQEFHIALSPDCGYGADDKTFWLSFDTRSGFSEVAATTYGTVCKNWVNGTAETYADPWEVTDPPFLPLGPTVREQIRDSWRVAHDVGTATIHGRGGIAGDGGEWFRAAQYPFTDAAGDKYIRLTVLNAAPGWVNASLDVLVDGCPMMTVVQREVSTVTTGWAIKLDPVVSEYWVHWEFRFTSPVGQPVATWSYYGPQLQYE